VYQLQKSNEAAHAQKYLAKRSLNNDIVHCFSLGYAQDSWNAMHHFFKNRSFSDNDILNAGLIIKKEGTMRYYDRFRGRLMFPIRNVNGYVVGFGARILNNDAAGAKYINSPQGMVYNKSDIVYGLYEAKNSIKQKDYVIVTEGYMDVLANVKVGIKNIIATS